MLVEILVMGLLLVAIFGGILFATRKKPGRKYENRAPGRAEADKDTWWWSG